MSYQLKNDSHPILVDYGDDQFTLRILDKCNTNTYTPLDSFSFKSVSSFLNKYKKPIKNKVKTLLQESPLLAKTDVYEDDDPVSKRILHQKSLQPQSSHVIHSLPAEIQNHQFDDSHLSREILIICEKTETPKVDNDSTSLTEISHSTNSLLFFDPAFFAHGKA